MSATGIHVFEVGSLLWREEDPRYPLKLHSLPQASSGEVPGDFGAALTPLNVKVIIMAKQSATNYRRE